MHDLKFIRENPEAFDAALARRGNESVSARILELDASRRALQTELQERQARRNEASKAIGAAMGQGDKEKAEALKAEVGALKEKLPQLEEQERTRGAELDGILASIPNLPFDDVPDGADEAENVEIAKWGTPRKFNFAVKDHADLGPLLGMDFETGVKLSGARFTFLRGAMARLHRALGQFMLDQQTGEKNGYSECATPYLVRGQAMFGTGQLPKFGHDLFFSADMEGRKATFDKALPPDFETRMAATSDGGFKSGLEAILEEAPTEEQFWLIPTAEVSLTNSVAGEILDDSVLPIRLTALTPCFRSEAGAAGKDTKGFIRQHQFEKVELVSITRPEDSEAEHERMTSCAEGILQALELPYRKVLLCTGDMGFGARKTYDLEVWLPGQDTYREISSCSNCGDFQARRMNARFRREDGGKPEFVHTLNGSGLAVGRTLVAVIENYQEADGSIVVPEVLRPYMGWIEAIEPAG